MVTIQEIEAYFNAKLMSYNLNKFTGMSQYSLIQKVEKVLRETLEDLGLEDKLTLSYVGSTINIRVSFDYAKDELHIEEGIARQMCWSWVRESPLFQIKIKKTKEKNKKGGYTGFYLFKNATLLAEDKTKTIDEVILNRAKEIEEIEKKAEEQRQIERKNDKEQWLTFYTKTLSDKGLSKEDFDELYKAYCHLPYLMSDDKEDLFKLLDIKEAA